MCCTACFFSFDWPNFASDFTIGNDYECVVLLLFHSMYLINFVTYSIPLLLFHYILGTCFVLHASFYLIDLTLFMGSPAYFLTLVPLLVSLRNFFNGPLEYNASSSGILLDFGNLDK